MISIVIPVRNDPDGVTRTLRSIQSQDYEGDLEIIVANGSSDNQATHNAIRAVAPEAIIITNENRIVSTAMNLGIRISKGDVIIRVDSRAELPEDYVRLCLSTLDETGAACVGGRQIVKQTSLFSRAFAQVFGSRFGSGNSTYKVGGESSSVDTVYMGAFRKSDLLTLDTFNLSTPPPCIGPYNDSLLRNQDYELNYRLRRAGHDIYFNPEIYSYYTPRRNLKQLASQYLDYGKWKKMMLLQHPKSLKFRQIILPILVLLLLSSATIPLLCGAGFLGIIIPLGYALRVLRHGLTCAIKERNPHYLYLVPSILVTMHLSWGLGFFIPARKLRKYNYKTRPEDNIVLS